MSKQSFIMLFDQENDSTMNTIERLKFMFKEFFDFIEVECGSINRNVAFPYLDDQKRFDVFIKNNLNWDDSNNEMLYSRWYFDDAQLPIEFILNYFKSCMNVFEFGPNKTQKIICFYN